ncbi:outer membrane transport energization protein ExbB [Breoghania corrubedonensis]|uniref:Outer membrane transport energization protein ExbB n=1 Tax=Breoghania corrubedonensis TaxID=665038 RepID=A0A2T5VCY9_9HYPH|nr:MotA/TolQ/ExbB proton channel family protein [Breoghania corrubedonensis]PTW61611.1 outer membrane transport energization protein ExbB [Breoghania corrubedonensis]
MNSSGLPPFLADMFAPILELARTGGPVVVLLGALSVITLALALAKLIQFHAAGTGRHVNARKVLRVWISGERETAMQHVGGERSVLGDVLVHLVRGASNGRGTEAQLREDIERVCLNKLAHLRSFLRPLDMIAQTAPLIGLFGTVLGMIQAFQSMQGAGANVDPSVLAGGIWVALLTTAVGLAVAIPTSVFVGWCDGRIEREQQAMEDLVTAFFTGKPTEAAPVGVVDLASHGRRHAH